MRAAATVGGGVHDLTGCLLVLHLSKDRAVFYSAAVGRSFYGELVIPKVDTITSATLITIFGWVAA